MSTLTVAADQPWVRHAIDADGQGADGVRLADVNGDGLLDIVTGWEESGQVKVCFNPGPDAASQPWPATVVGPARAVEDAVAVDLDGDGLLEVVSSCEKGELSIRIHRQAEGGSAEDPAAWDTQVLPASRDVMQWMYIAPAQIDGKHGTDLVAGGKKAGASIGWFESPRLSTDLEAWRWHPLADVGWVMGIDLHDINGDGYPDIVYTDRRGQPGVYWLQHPGEDLSKPWRKHTIGLQNLQNPDGPRRDAILAFFAFADVDADGLTDLVVAADRQIAIFRKDDASGQQWDLTTIPMPPAYSGAKSVRVADLDGNGRFDIAFTTLTAKPGQSLGVGMVSSAKGLLQGPYTFTDIGGPTGEKFDLLELIDLDGDGDLDLLTCEESTGLGVIWYENPAAKP